MSMEQYYGEIQKCGTCTNAAGVHMNCSNCFAHGFVAKCTNCDGKGQTEAPVAGAASGTMKSTCPSCGGRGVFGVRKPADWVEPEAPEKKELATA